MASSYQYIPLQTPRSIRVLEISPSSPTDPDIIHCEIRSTTVETARDTFDAVSYAWGDPTPCKTIYCGTGNAQLKVPLNCYNAICELRHRDSSRALWIDAVCINQADTAERSLQLKIMGDIFAGSNKTIVFLGNSTSGSPTLFRHFAAIEQWESTGGDGSPPSPPPGLDIVHEMEELFEKPWFDRAWVNQEFVRPAQVEFMCGNDIATKRAFMTCLTYWQHHTHHFKRVPAPLYLETHDFKFTIADSSNPVERMLIYAMGADACGSTDPRDRILALTPFIKDRPPALENLIRYDGSVGDLFYEFARLLLDQVGLAILRVIRYPSEHTGIPSWVPNWSEAYGRPHEIKDLTLFNPDYPTPAVWAIDEANRHLTLTGVRKGHITEVGPVLHIPDLGTGLRIEAVKALFNSLYAVIHGIALPNWPDAMVSRLRGLVENDISSLFGGMGSIIDIDEDTYTNIADTCKHGVRIFMTSEYEVGRTSADARPGDVVVIVQGAMEPCVLRRKDDASNLWVLISGDCALSEVEQKFTIACRSIGRGSFVSAFLNETNWGEKEQFTIC